MNLAIQQQQFQLQEELVENRAKVLESYMLAGSLNRSDATNSTSRHSDTNQQSASGER